MPKGHDWTFERRFMSRVKVADSGCWIWQGPPKSRGKYGQLQVNGINWSAHRYAYLHLVGPVPDGLHLDHVCRDTMCVNPDHLEPVTPAENTRRTMFYRPEPTHCAKGHEYPTAKQPGERRQCVVCRRDASRRRNALRPRKGHHNSRKTHCVNGHPLSGGNLGINSTNGGRYCLICARVSRAAYAQRRTAQRRLVRAMREVDNT